MELVQLSTSWCPPCKMAREYIEKNFDVDFLNYKFILIDKDEILEEKYIEIIKRLKPRSVPLFAVLNDDDIIYTFNGFNIDEINKYAEYMVRTQTSTIKDSITKDRSDLEQKLYNDIIDNLQVDVTLEGLLFTDEDDWEDEDDDLLNNTNHRPIEDYDNSEDEIDED